MISQRTVYKCDLCHEERGVGQIYRVQHLIDNSDLRNIKPAGIELYTVQETIGFNQSSSTCVCFQCCQTIRKTTGGSLNCTIGAWVKWLTIGQMDAGKWWVRWTGADGIYRWLHPNTNQWIEEPHQITMPTFKSELVATLAAEKSPIPPTWEEYEKLLHDKAGSKSA